MTELRPGDHHAPTLTWMLHELVAWGGALKHLRDTQLPPGAA